VRLKAAGSLGQRDEKSRIGSSEAGEGQKSYQVNSNGTDWRPVAVRMERSGANRIWVICGHLILVERWHTPPGCFGKKAVSMKNKQRECKREAREFKRRQALQRRKLEESRAQELGEACESAGDVDEGQTSFTKMIG